MEKANNHKENKEPFFESIDFIKLIDVVRKSIPWIILIMIGAATVSYLYIRWTKPVYESTSVLKLDIKSEASVFGFNSYEENLNNLSGERELLLSRLFHNKALDVVNLDVSYYAYGNVLYDERYGNSPFQVDYEILAHEAYDKTFDVELISDRQFRLEYELNGKTHSEVYAYGETIKTPWFEFAVNLTDHYKSDLSEKEYFFRINSRESLLNYISDNMSVEFLSLNAKTIQISFKDHNKYKARDLVNAIDTLYIHYTNEEKKKANSQKINFLNNQLSSTEEKLEDFENYFENFTINNKTTDLEADLNKTIVELERLDTQRYVANERLLALEDLHNRLTEKKAFYLNPLQKDVFPPGIFSMTTQLNDLLKEKEMLLGSYRENTYAVRKKSQEIEFLREKLTELALTARQEQYDILKSLNQEKRRLEKSFVELPGKGTEFNKSSRYYSLYEEFYLSLMQRKTEFEIAQAGTVTDFVILSPATMPATPIYPPRIIIYGLGLLAGILLSSLTVGVRYLLHNKITSQTELEHLTNAAFLGIVPHYKNGYEDGQLVVSAKPRSAISESLRTIRTNMEFVSIASEKKVISITSTTSGEGKTFLAINLGGIMAFSKNRVTLVDLDMRKPRINYAFKNENTSKGVSSTLIGKHNIDDCIYDTEIENLKYIPSGPVPPNPSELLLSPAFDKLLNDLKERFDLIILDTPPVGIVADAVLIMKKVDLPLYVFRAGYSKRVFTKTLNRLIGVNKFHNIAVILNAVKSSKGTTYGYGYNYYYSDSGYYEEETGSKKKIKKKILNKLS